MELSGTRRLPTDPETVWRALMDPTVLRRCIPGCVALNKQSDTQFNMVIEAKVGTIKSRFAGAVTLSDLDPPSRYTLTGEGQSPAGFVRGRAEVQIDPAGATDSRLSYRITFETGGKLAQVGPRLIESTGARLSDTFFINLFNAMGGNPRNLHYGEHTETSSYEDPERAATSFGPRVWGPVVLLLFILLLLMLVRR